ncbi:hypothetical protein [Luteipulveratus mongoliensis]|uniref:hypothetical protein n=1 Tax=Luteipulveratus mongoliensis TaxID=571913 RepID=UPI000695A7E2|nr:hypothetical protein [Luteipulveratus mongoliensis]
MLSTRPVAIALTALVAGGVITTVSAQAASAEDSNCRTTTGSHDTYNGPSASKTYDSTFHNSVAVPKGLYDGEFTPQGLAYWNNWNGTSEDILLVSAYHDGNQNKTPDGSSAIWGIALSGPHRGQSLGHMLIPNTHAGGIVVTGGHVYVSGEGGVQYWSTSTVRKALSGANSSKTVKPKGKQNLAGQGSFLGLGGGNGTTLWTGDFSEKSHQSMWQYKPSSSGKLTYTGKKRWVPSKTQGMTVVGDKYVFATSSGRDNRSNVWVRPSKYTSDLTDGTSFCMRAPSMMEGLAYGNSDGNKHVWALYESGSKTYFGDKKTLNKIKHIHWAGGSALAGLYGQKD